MAAPQPLAPPPDFNIERKHPMKALRSLQIAIAILVSLSTCRMYAADKDEKEVTADGPWISAVAWQDAEHVVGARSQGLLFRPAEVVRSAVGSLEELTVIGQSETSLWAVLPLPDGKVVASDYRGGIHVFGDGEPAAFETEARWIRALCQSPQEPKFLAGTEDGKLIVLNLEDRKEEQRIDAHGAAIFDIAFNSAGDQLATAAGDGTIKIFSWPKLEQLKEMSVGSEAVWSVLFVNNDSQLVSGGADRRIQLWDVGTSRSIVTITKARNWITSLVNLPDSNLVAAGCMDGNVVIADFATMQAVTSAAGPGSAIWSIALSDDGQRLALGTRKDGLAMLDTSEWIEAGKAAAKQAAEVRPPSPSRQSRTSQPTSSR